MLKLKRKNILILIMIFILSLAINIFGTLPNDKFLDGNQDGQWDVFDTVTNADGTPWHYEYLWGLKNINMPEVWDNSQLFHPTDNTKIKLGDDVIVAIIDTGVYQYCEDLNYGNYLTNLEKDYYYNDSTAEDLSGYYHGTHITGIIAAQGNNGKGIIGMAPNVKYLPLKIVYNSYQYDDNYEIYLQRTADAIIYAADNGADIINISLGYSLPSNRTIPLSLLNAVDYAKSKGCLVVGAAGSSAYPTPATATSNIWIPANIPDIIAVGAITSQNVTANYSNYSSKIDLVAPGEHIYSLSRAGANRYLGRSFGTDSAAAYVSGMLALLKANRPHLNNTELKTVLLTKLVKDLGIPGKDDIYGYGKLYVNKYTDITGPRINSVIDSGDYTTDKTQLSASWSLIDANADVSQYEYAIGTTKGSSDIVSWTSVALNTQVTKTGLNLENNKLYYFSVRAKETSSNVYSPVVSSDGIIVNLTDPIIINISDEGNYTTNNNSLSATWNITNTQNYVVEYQYSIGTSAGNNDVVDWTSVGTQTHISNSNLNLQKGYTYYFNLKAKDANNQWSPIYSSDGIKSQIINSINDGITNPNLNSLSANWSLVSENIIVQEYQYSIGTTPNETNIKNWTTIKDTQVTVNNLTLNNLQIYYFNLKAKDVNGNWTPIINSDGVLVSITSPILENVTDEGVFTPNNDYLNVSWSLSNTANAQVVEYQYSIGTNPGLVDILNWTTTTNNNIKITNLNLQNNKTYYINVRVKDINNLWSSTKSSDGITIYDPSSEITINIPNLDTFNNTLYTDPSINISFPNNSNIVKYKIQVFTKNGNLYTESVTLNIVATTATTSNKSLQITATDNQISLNIASLLPKNTECYIKILAFDSYNNVFSKQTDTFTYLSQSNELTVSNVISYPNPFNSNNQNANIRFTISKQAYVKLSIFSLNGKQVYTKHEKFDIGTHILSWDGTDNFNQKVANGLYFAYLYFDEANGEKNIKKLIKMAILK